MKSSTYKVEKASNGYVVAEEYSSAYGANSSVTYICPDLEDVIRRIADSIYKEYQGISKDIEITFKYTEKEKV